MLSADYNEQWLIELIVIAIQCSVAIWAKLRGFCFDLRANDSNNNIHTHKQIYIYIYKQWLIGIFTCNPIAPSLCTHTHTHTTHFLFFLYAYRSEQGQPIKQLIDVLCCAKWTLPLLLLLLPSPLLPVITRFTIK